jgi:hypothetical protein
MKPATSMVIRLRLIVTGLPLQRVEQERMRHGALTVAFTKFNIDFSAKGNGNKPWGNSRTTGRSFPLQVQKLNSKTTTMQALNC